MTAMQWPQQPMCAEAMHVLCIEPLIPCMTRECGSSTVLLCTTCNTILNACQGR